MANSVVPKFPEADGAYGTIDKLEETRTAS
jgi:hypothetical protein